MPHDANGTLLEKGDVVELVCRVKDVQAGEEYCNLTIETVTPMYPGNSVSCVVVNAKQVVLRQKQTPATRLSYDQTTGGIHLVDKAA